jgi:hypothetical protein
MEPAEISRVPAERNMPEPARISALFEPSNR